MFIVLESFGGAEYAFPAQHEDGSGNFVFNTREEAEQFAEDLQVPVIVEL